MNDYIKSKWVYGMIILTVFAIIIWIIAGTSEPEAKNELPVNQETYTMETAQQESSESTTDEANGYYLVKADEGKIKVYWIDVTGEHLHRETNIPYPLLSVEDQEMLDEGIMLETDEELASFLENYDS